MNETTPKISVIVPVYKAEAYLHRCVDSILAQTFQDFEVLLVNDGSPDKSGEICDEYARKDKRVRVFHKENGGVSSARNMGLDNARGEWICFMDSDDYVKHDYLHNLLINSCDVDGVICGFEVRSNREHIKNIICLKHIENIEDLEFIWITLGELDAEHYIWNHLYRSKTIKENGIYFRKISTGEDTLFNLDYFKHSKSIRLISYVGYVHYDNIGSLSKGYRVDYKDFYNEYIRSFPLIFDCKKKYVRKYYIHIRMSYLYGYIFNIKSEGSPFNYFDQIELIRKDLLNRKNSIFIKLAEINKKSWIIFRILIILNSAILLELFYRIYIVYLQFRKKLIIS